MKRSCVKTNHLGNHSWHEPTAESLQARLAPDCAIVFQVKIEGHVGDGVLRRLKASARRWQHVGTQFIWKASLCKRTAPKSAGGERTRVSLEQKEGFHQWGDSCDESKVMDRQKRKGWLNWADIYFMYFHLGLRTAQRSPWRWWCRHLGQSYQSLNLNDETCIKVVRPATDRQAGACSNIKAMQNTRPCWRRLYTDSRCQKNPLALAK